VRLISLGVPRHRGTREPGKFREVKKGRKRFFSRGYSHQKKRGSIRERRGQSLQREGGSPRPSLLLRRGKNVIHLREKKNTPLLEVSYWDSRLLDDLWKKKAKNTGEKNRDTPGERRPSPSDQSSKSREKKPRGPQRSLRRRNRSRKKKQGRPGKKPLTRRPLASPQKRTISRGTENKQKWKEDPVEGENRR